MDLQEKQLAEYEIDMASRVEFKSTEFDRYYVQRCSVLLSNVVWNCYHERANIYHETADITEVVFTAKTQQEALDMMPRYIKMVEDERELFGV